MSRAVSFAVIAAWLCTSAPAHAAEIDFGFVDLATTQSPTLAAGFTRLIAEELARCAGTTERHLVLPAEATARILSDHLLAEHWPLATFDKNWLERAGRSIGVENVLSTQLNDNAGTLELSLRAISLEHHELLLARRLQLNVATLGDQVSSFAEELLNAATRSQKERHCRRSFAVGDWHAVELFERARAGADTERAQAVTSLALAEPEFALATAVIFADETPPPFSFDAAEKEARDHFTELQQKEHDPEKQKDKWRQRIAALMVERKYSRVMAYARIALPLADKAPVDKRFTSDLWVYLLGAEEALNRADDFNRDATAFLSEHADSAAAATIATTRDRLAAKADERRAKQPLAEKELRRMSSIERRDPCRVGRMYRKNGQRAMARVYLESCVGHITPNLAVGSAIAAWQDLIGIFVELGDFAAARDRLADLERRDPKLARSLRPLANSLPVE